ncbi:LPS assembly protein LptD [uncultured Planktomarina sp.]|uniref:LPS-assembly protein LptD n=1 Tax=uncultured Planktomarina sp. TaxID=1538529 RepID=UPI00325FF2DD
MIRLFLLTVLWLSAAQALWAQDAAHLIADRIEILPNGTLRASGSVTVWHGEVQITARDITYASSEGQLSLSGPIKLQDGSGTVILADQADLSPDLSAGIITSARIILSQQVQIAAAQISRVNATYSEASHVSATSCFVCNGQTPLWQIRAKRIVHDSAEKQIYFDQAQLRLMDVPVFFFPYLRLPDPSLKRATGFLVPELTTSTTLGTAIRTPYFIKLGAHRDITLSPMVSSRTNTLGLRYRHAYRTGIIELEGAYSRDTLLAGQDRGYLFGTANFALDTGYALTGQLQSTSDPAYLFEYDVKEIDRLENKITLERSQSDRNIELRFSNYHSLRDSESNATQPTLVTEAIVQQRGYPGGLGGVLDLEASLLTSYRSSTSPVDGPDSGDEVDGYDTLRLSSLAKYRRDWVLPKGLVVDFATELEASQYVVRQHQNIAPVNTRISGSGALGLRWPLAQRFASGALQRLEPRVQLAGVVSNSDPIPNQDSTQVEFDEGNLFRFNRAPGFDLIETGTRVNIGLTGGIDYPNQTKIGWEIGRIYRTDSANSFTKTSGLGGHVSDWLLATHIKTPLGIELVARSLLKDFGQLTKSEIRASWRTDKHRLHATYAGLTADEAENRDVALSSLALKWNYQFLPDWLSTSEFQFDTSIGEPSKFKFGLEYANECVVVDFSASRRFATSSTLTDKTEFGLSVELAGFSTGVRNIKKSRQCGAL